MKLRKKEVLWSLILLFPACLMYGYYFYNTPNNATASGFIQSDMYSYMANARQFMDDDNASIFYSNPFDSDTNAPKIYSQPQILILAFCIKVLHLSPSLSFLIFGFLFGWLFMLACVLLYQQFFDLKGYKHIIGLIIFVYGGGLLIFSGSLWYLLYDSSSLSAVFRYDPGEGWWMLNFGRNLIYPLESYYHFLVLLSFILFFKNKHLGVCFTLFILSWSHPFYGIEFLIVFAAIYSIEFVYSIIKKEKQKKTYYPLTIILALLTIHIYYYLMFLPSFESHQSLMSQWKIDWSHGVVSLSMAYIFGLLLTGINIYNYGGFSKFFSVFHHRVLTTWFLICLLFVNHNLFINPIQPLHFDKGYVLAPLWLMGLPVLFNWVKILGQKYSKGVLILASIAVIFIILSDNIAWFAGARADSNGYIYSDERLIFETLEKTYTKNDLLISNDDELPYKATVYCSINAYISHGYNTPHWEDKKKICDKLFSSSKFPAELSCINQGKLVLVINTLKKTLDDSKISKKLIYKNSTYQIFEITK